MAQPHLPTPIDRPAVLANIEADVEDNLSSAITAEDVRLRLRDIAVSFVNVATDVSGDLDFDVDPTAFATRETIKDFVLANGGGVPILESTSGDNTESFETYVNARNGARQPILLSATPGVPFYFEQVISGTDYVDTMWEGVAGDGGSPTLIFNTGTGWTLGLNVGMRNFNYEFGNGEFTLQSNGTQNPVLSGGGIRNALDYRGGSKLTFSNASLDLSGDVDVLRPARQLDIQSCVVRVNNLSCTTLVVQRSAPTAVASDVVVRGDLTTNGSISISDSVVEVHGDMYFDDTLALSQGAVLIVNGDLMYATTSASIVVEQGSLIHVRGALNVETISVSDGSTVRVKDCNVDFINMVGDGNVVHITGTTGSSGLGSASYLHFTLNGTGNNVRLDRKNDTSVVQVISGDTNTVSVGVLTNDQLTSTLAGTGSTFEFNGSLETILVQCDQSVVKTTSGANVSMLGATQNSIDCRGVFTFSMDVTTSGNHIKCYHSNGYVGGENNTIHTTVFEKTSINGSNNSVVTNTGFDSSNGVYISGTNNSLTANHITGIYNVIVSGENCSLKANSIKTTATTYPFVEITGDKSFVHLGSDVDGYYIDPNVNSTIFYNGATQRHP